MNKEPIFNYVIAHVHDNGELEVAGYALATNDVVQFGTEKDARLLLSHVYENQPKPGGYWQIIKIGADAREV